MPDVAEFTRQAAALVARNDRLPAQRTCGCLVIWDELSERRVWVSGSTDGSCGHPSTGDPYLGGD